MRATADRELRRFWITIAVAVGTVLLFGTMLTIGLAQTPYTTASGTVTSVQKHFQARTWHYRARVDLGDHAVSVDYQSPHPGVGDTVTVYHSSGGWAPDKPASWVNVAGGWMFAFVPGAGAGWVTWLLTGLRGRRVRNRRSGRV